MKQTVLMTACVLVLSGALSGCGGVRDSRVNPLNWFGASREGPELGETRTEIDNRVPVEQITALSIERTSSGALVRVEGVAPSLGWWDAGLVAENRGRPVDGVLTFRFVAAAPRTPQPQGSARARTLVAAVPINEVILEQTARVVVAGATNSRSINR